MTLTLSWRLEPRIVLGATEAEVEWQQPALQELWALPALDFQQCAVLFVYGCLPLVSGHVSGGFNGRGKLFCHAKLLTFTHIK